MGKIDKESVKSTASLYNEIGKYEYAVNKKNFYTPKQDSLDSKGKLDIKKPCKICENLKKGVRFHREEKCLFKQTNDYYQKKNYNRTVNHSVIDVELNDNDSKNE